MTTQAARPTKNPLRAHASGPAPIIPTEAAPAETEREKTERMNIYIPVSVADYMRDISYTLGREYSLGELVAQAMPALFAELEETRNGGKKFRPRPDVAKKLPTGPSVQKNRTT